ncbi:MAG: NAD(P)/FAD-dependent oxidoreductase [Alistipes sp.]|nr:NAD(P)/FAD-dependent oxidoreductase [Alistipes sp.]MBR6672667.1 NAD(P)/FAD-dependent oxidoreductase [Alistipes sp.]
MALSDFEKQMEKLQQEGVINRAQFLQIMAATGAFLALGTNKAYAAKSSAKGKIVIVGGGAAGISMASRLKRKLSNPDITIIDPSDRQFYQPGFTLIASGVYSADEVWKPQSECMPSGVKWVKDSVTLIHPTQNKVDTAKNGTIDYDFLVLCPGAQINWNKVEGISKETLGLGNAHSIYDWVGAQRTWPAMREFGRKGGKGIFCDTYTKHKCGGAPKKICLLSWDNARKNNNLDKIEMHYYTGSKQLYDVPYFTPRLEQIYKERNIPVDMNCRIKAVDVHSKRAYFERVETLADGTKRSTPFSEDYDFLHFMAPQSAPDFVRDSGLSWTEGKLAADGWAMANKETLVHLTYNNIICLGDCAGIPTSKTSAAIGKQLPIAVENLISIMEGRAPEAIYNGYAACPIVTEYGKVLMAEFDYKKEPQITFPLSLLDMSKEQWVAWLLKVYGLKPIYFNLMLTGLY